MTINYFILFIKKMFSDLSNKEKAYKNTLKKSVILHDV